MSPCQPSKCNKKYLELDESGFWHLFFLYFPPFAGKVIRNILFTKNISIAKAVRNRFVVPVRLFNSGVVMLEEIGKFIINAEAMRPQSSLTNQENITRASDGMFLSDAYCKYLERMENSSTYRPATKKYREKLRLVLDFLGNRKAVKCTQKQTSPGSYRFSTKNSTSFHKRISVIHRNSAPPSAETAAE